MPAELARPVSFFFFQAEDGIRDGHVTGVQTCALPISRLEFILRVGRLWHNAHGPISQRTMEMPIERASDHPTFELGGNRIDRKSTPLNSSHVAISYAVFCLKKKKQNKQKTTNDERTYT